MATGDSSGTAVTAYGAGGDYRFSLDDLTWVMDKTSLAHLRERIAVAFDIVMDLETTGLDERSWTGGPRNGGVGARVVLASFTLACPDDTGQPGTWVVPLSHPDSPFLGAWRGVLRVLSQSIAEAQGGLVNQNVKFDCRWVHAATGMDLSSKIAWDTRISSHLLDENHSTSLKERAPRTFGIRRWDDFSLKEPGAAETVPLLQLGEYAARDTYWTWALAHLHRSLMALDAAGDGEGVAADEPTSTEDVEAARLGKLAVWCAMPTTATLTAVEQRGIMLDREWTRAELSSRRSEAARLTAELADRYGQGGQPSFAPTANWFREWAQRAVDAGDLRVAALTPKGKPQWNRAVLVQQARRGSQVADDLLELRGHTKKAEYLAAWLGYQDRDGAIRCQYNAGSVVTGRLSSSEPNMQQVTAALKPAFVPRPGFVLADLDFSQIELRIAAFISRCEPMLAAFRRGDDLHRLLAARITEKSPSAVTPEERQSGKSANFGLLYGMSAHGFRYYAADVYGVDLTMEEATAFHRAFFQVWDGMSAWHARTVLRVRQTGQVVSPIGRVRRLPGIFDPAQASFAERAGINAPVQGFASDIMQIAAASITGNLPGHRRVEGAFIVATVHDSILVEVPEDRWERSVEACRERMVEGAPAVLRKMDCVLDVPLEVEAKVGSRWGLSDIGTM